MHELLNYVIRFFGDHMTKKEKLAHKHLLASLPLNETEQRLLSGLAWGKVPRQYSPYWAKSFLLQYQSRLSHDPEVLRLASGGLETFLKRTAPSAWSGGHHRFGVSRHRCGLGLFSRQNSRCEMSIQRITDDQSNAWRKLMCRWFWAHSRHFIRSRGQHVCPMPMEDPS